MSSVDSPSRAVVRIWTNRLNSRRVALSVSFLLPPTNTPFRPSLSVVLLGGAKVWSNEIKVQAKDYLFNKRKLYANRKMTVPCEVRLEMEEAYSVS